MKRTRTKTQMEETRNKRCRHSPHPTWREVVRHKWFTRLSWYLSYEWEFSTSTFLAAQVLSTEGKSCMGVWTGIPCGNTYGEPGTCRRRGLRIRCCHCGWTSSSCGPTGSCGCCSSRPTICQTGGYGRNRRSYDRWTHHSHGNRSIRRVRPRKKGRTEVSGELGFKMLA